MSKKQLFALALIVLPFFVSGCGAPKPPTPFGAKVSITQFAQKRAQENRQKVAEAAAQRRAEELTASNITFGCQTDDYGQ